MSLRRDFYTMHRAEWNHEIVQNRSLMAFMVQRYEKNSILKWKDEIIKMIHRFTRSLVINQMLRHASPTVEVVKKGLRRSLFKTISIWDTVYRQSRESDILTLVLVMTWHVQLVNFFFSIFQVFYVLSPRLHGNINIIKIFKLNLRILKCVASRVIKGKSENQKIYDILVVFFQEQILFSAHNI